MVLEKIKNKTKELAKVPFNSEYKFSTYSVGADEGICKYTLIKGAPEKIISLCTLYQDGTGDYNATLHNYKTPGTYTIKLYTNSY